jgi:hypothetical protein
LLRFRIIGMDPDEYVIGCLFLGDPLTPLNPAHPAGQPRNLLQPFQLLDRLRFFIAKDPTSVSSHGDVVVEKI